MTKLPNNRVGDYLLVVLASVGGSWVLFGVLCLVWLVMDGTAGFALEDSLRALAGVSVMAVFFGLVIAFMAGLKR